MYGFLANRAADRWALVIVLMFVVLGGFLRYNNIGATSLWMDEVRQASYYYGSSSYLDVVDKASTQNQPPLDYLIGYTVAKIFSFSETVVRFQALVFGTALIPLFYLFARLYTDSRTALTAISFIVVSPYLIRYSQEARPYAIHIFFYYLSL